MVIAELLAVAASLPQHLHLVGANFGAVLFHAALVCPFAGAQAPLDVHLRAFAQVLACYLSQAANKNDTMPLSSFAHFSALFVFPFVGGRDTDVGNVPAVWKGANFWVFAQVPDDDDFVNGCHIYLSFPAANPPGVG